VQSRDPDHTVVTHSLERRIRSVPWELVVSFKTEVLSECLIQSNMHRIQWLFGWPLKKMFMLDNDIHEDCDEIARTVDAIAQYPVKAAAKANRVIETLCQKLLTASQRLQRRRLRGFSNSELAELLDQWLDQYGEVVGLIAVPAMVDRVLERVLRDELRLAAPHDVEELFRVLAHTDRLTETGRARAALLRLALSQSKFSPEKRRNAIKRYVAQYGWTSTTLLGGTPLTPDDVAASMREAGRPDVARVELKQLMLDIRENAARTRVLMRQYRLSPQLRRLVATFRRYMWIRTARLEWTNQACTMARPLLECCADRLGLAYEELIYALPEEILQPLRRAERFRHHAQVWERLRKYAMVTFDGRQTHLASGAVVDRLLKNPQDDQEVSRDLHGLPACPGIVRGRVRLLKDRSEIRKLRQGEVLITRLTTPDFLPAMQRSVAIVTDLGGITSHTAIVSRELRKPCIVGTKNATKVLHDGDLVEVDAEKGVVRVVKRLS